MRKKLKKFKRKAQKVTRSKFITEFKAFALKGKVLDLAIAVTIGAAFGKIVSSLVSNIIMPIVGILIGGYDFNTLAFNSSIWGRAISIPYGIFLQNVVDFLIIALSVFLFIKFVKFVRDPEEVKKDKTEALLEEIRDLLKEK